MGSWYIVKTGSGSFDGPGYQYRHRPEENRSLGHTLVYLPKGSE